MAARAVDDELGALLAGVPSFEAFLDVDELADAARELADSCPKTASLTRIGTSRLGEPLHSLRVGDADRSAIVFAGVHPNEPIGGLTALHLARVLCEDAGLRRRLDLTWHIVPCIDPDGGRLNHGWLKGPFTRSHYGKHFYRPRGDEQVEWTFPFQYKDAYFDRVMPETLALMRLIDEAKPAFMCSLHNGELGGVYYYLSRPVPTLYETLKSIPSQLGLPLDLGEPEVPYVTKFDDAIFAMIRSEDGYDFLEQVGVDPTARVGGASSASYAERHGTLTLVSELPYWIDTRAQDQSPIGDSYSSVLRRHGTQIQELVDTLSSALEATQEDLVTRSPFLRATLGFLPDFRRMPAQDEFRAAQQDSQRPATVAEEHSLQDNVHCFRLRYAGMLLRALQGEIGIGNGTIAIRREHGRLADRYDAWCQEADAATPARHVPIGKLVANQFGAIVATADGLDGSP